MSERPPAGNNPETEVSHESGYEVSCKEFHELLEELLRRPYRSDGPLLTEDDRFVGLNDVAWWMFRKFQSSCPHSACRRSTDCTRSFNDEDHLRNTLLAKTTQRAHTAREFRLGTWAPRARVRAARAAGEPLSKERWNVGLAAQGPESVDHERAMWTALPEQSEGRAELMELEGAIRRFDYSTWKEPWVIRDALLHSVLLAADSWHSRDALVTTHLKEADPARYESHPDDDQRTQAAKRARLSRKVRDIREAMEAIQRSLGYYDG